MVLFPRSDQSDSYMKKNSGFTLTEMVITIGLLIIIFTFASISLIGSIRRPAEAGAYNVLVSDLRAQQIKSMMGKGDAFGIDLEANSYTLTPDNFTVNLPEGFVFASAPQQIVFAKGTGETTAITVNLVDSQNGAVREIKINKYGATTE